MRAEVAERFGDPGSPAPPSYVTTAIDEGGSGSSERLLASARIAGPAFAGRSSDSQAMTALGAARANDGTSAAGLHADEEAVRALATDDGRLIGALHDG